MTGIEKGDDAPLTNNVDDTTSPTPETPHWLQIGLFVVATATTAAGIYLLATNPPLSPEVIIPFALSIGIFGRLMRRGRPSAVDRYADQIRTRVDSESTRMHFHVERGGVVHVGSSEQDEATIRISDSLEKQETILREIYTQGLAQAKLSFKVSIAFASFGSSLLLLGIGLAVFKAESTGGQYASIVAGTAGIVINLTSSLFFVQSNRAQTNMGNQGVMLREESQEDRRLNAARELTSAINDEELRNRVRARLALNLLNIEDDPEQESSTGQDTETPQSPQSGK